MWEICRPFSASHGIAFALALVAWILVIRSAIRVRGSHAEHRWRLRMGAFILATNLGWQVYKLTPGGWSLDTSLPCQLCDLAWMCAAWSILSGRRLPSVLLYYWGIGLSTQAFVTPTVAYGPVRAEYWAFWTLHWQIVAVPLINAIAFGLRPGWRDLAAAVVTTFTLFLAITGLNLLLETNYFFTGRTTPGTATLLDHLGPWPLRLVWLVLIVGTLFVLMTLPWTCLRRSPQAEGSPSPGPP